MQRFHKPFAGWWNICLRQWYLTGTVLFFLCILSTTIRGEEKAGSIADLASPWSVLAGQTWHGTLHVVTTTHLGDCADQMNRFDLVLTIRVAPATDRYTEGGTHRFYGYACSIKGKVHVTNPTFKLRKCGLPTYVGSVVYSPLDYTVEGSDAKLYGIGFHVNGWDALGGVRVHAHTDIDLPVVGRISEDDADEISIEGLPDTLPIQIMDSDHLTLNSTQAMTPASAFHSSIPVLAMTGASSDTHGEITTTGNLSTSLEQAPARGNQRLPLAGVLAALLGYLALVIPGMIMNPQSSEIASMAGTLIGSLEALKGFGFDVLANQAKVGGFVGAAAAESFEIWRIAMASTSAGETAATTAARVAISAIPDIAAFAASALITEAAVGVAITGAAIVGPVAAGVVAVAGAGLITYGIGAAATGIKTWATGIFNSWLAK